MAAGERVMCSHISFFTHALDVKKQDKSNRKIWAIYKPPLNKARTDVTTAQKVTKK
jgi:hypothetical protein